MASPAVLAVIRLACLVTISWIAPFAAPIRLMSKQLRSGGESNYDSRAFGVRSRHASHREHGLPPAWCAARGTAALRFLWRRLRPMRPVGGRWAKPLRGPAGFARNWRPRRRTRYRCGCLSVLHDPRPPRLPASQSTQHRPLAAPLAEGPGSGSASPAFAAALQPSKAARRDVVAGLAWRAGTRSRAKDWCKGNSRPPRKGGQE